MQTVVETPGYLSDASSIFSAEEREAVVELVAANPSLGVLIPGTGGVRKVRFGFGGRGKRGGARIIYYVAGADLPIFLLAAFAKNERADLSPAEQLAVGRTARQMGESYRRRQ